MTREDRKKTKDASRREQERQPKEHKAGSPIEHKAGPPIEREHETREGIEEEDAKRKQEHERR